MHCNLASILHDRLELEKSATSQEPLTMDAGLSKRLAQEWRTARWGSITIVIIIIMCLTSYCNSVIITIVISISFPRNAQYPQANSWHSVTVVLFMHCAGISFFKAWALSPCIFIHVHVFWCILMYVHVFSCIFIISYQYHYSQL